jgi:hypothetical protein
VGDRSSGNVLVRNLQTVQHLYWKSWEEAEGAAAEQGGSLGECFGSLDCDRATGFGLPPGRLVGSGGDRLSRELLHLLWQTLQCSNPLH